MGFEGAKGAGGAAFEGEGRTDLVVRSSVLDLAMLHRNVRDLAKTAGFAHTDELEELFLLSYQNLKAKMVPGQPLAEDPALVIDTFKMVSGVMLQTVETKRKAADTLLKARVLIDVGSGDAAGSEEPLDGEPEGAQVSEAGVFGAIAEDVEMSNMDDDIPESG